MGVKNCLSRVNSHLPDRALTIWMMMIISTLGTKNTCDII